MELWYTEKHSDSVNFSLKVKEHLFSGQSEFQKLDVLDTYEYGKLMTLDGLVMVTEKDEFVYHDMIVHTPMAVNPNIKNVLVIGGGDGGTVRELMRYETIEHVDMVEIDKLVCDAAKEYFPTISCELENPRVTLLYEDGVKFVKESPDNKYDLIIIDSTDPIGPGEGLFSTEFYTNCHRILAEDGILVNQNESVFYEDTQEAALKANSKLKKIFPIVHVYQANIPTYPSGYWLFGFASKKYDPIKDLQADKWNNFGLKTKYYNTDLHIGAFALPSFVKEFFENGTIQFL
ncbi:polyamine aminopropyltransferase [Tepidibacter formicigenes]|jgi:spermidine synthase|uniref:Polyamine aminopropyltransferase n=1 Tax=Tepidibacter formicigenes DSM 15518 TaxID=1123349 RepID=A0A1M6LNY1_9FIRM|nr:polyamine aminopropyltransferase [Tepidibacter formicigenes]SHJ72865.1 spermidine synthase [Tepidibacter formicigenes DSM 15518]